MSDELRCERAGSAHAAALLELFDAAGTGCFCNYWHFAGDKNAWMEQCYLKPDLNRTALVERLAQGELCGVVAMRGATACGWLKLSRAQAIPRLYDQRVYRNLPCFQAGPDAREGVYAIACAYVAEPERRRGVAKALLAAAIAETKVAGGSALEAFPRGTPQGEPLRADHLSMGPETLFVEAGFVAVSDFRPYPVLRLHLR